MLLDQTALLSAFDFTTKTAAMVFEAGTVLDLKEVADYWNDATDNTAKVIKIDCGDLSIELRRSDNGRWIRQ